MKAVTEVVSSIQNDLIRCSLNRIHQFVMMSSIYLRLNYLPPTSWCSQRSKGLKSGLRTDTSWETNGVVGFVKSGLRFPYLMSWTCWKTYSFTGATWSIQGFTGCAQRNAAALHHPDCSRHLPRSQRRQIQYA